MKIKTLSHFVFLLILVGLLQGCVGTVEEGKTPTTQYADPKQAVFEFKGILDGRAISATRIEVEFIPSSDPNVVYFLHTNGDSGTQLNSEDLLTSLSGRVSYVVRNLSIDTLYKFKITAKNLVTGEISNNEKEITVKTFNDWTSDFEGIQDASLVPGRSDTTVRIRWYNPDAQGALQPIERDPRAYELTFVKQEDGGAALLKEANPDKTKMTFIKIPSTDPDLGASNYLGVSNRPESAVIKNLQPNTTYSFRMRSVHASWLTQYIAVKGASAGLLMPYDDTVVPFKREQNTRYITIKTDSPLNPASFETNSLAAVTPPDETGYKSVKLTWKTATGLFNRYRILYKRVEPSVNQATLVQTEDYLSQADLATLQGEFDSNAKSCTTNEEWGCINVDTDTTAYTVTGLTPEHYYQFKLIVCRNEACSLDLGISEPNIASAKVYSFTTAQLPPFGGITFINQPQDGTSITSGLKITMDFTLPSRSTGYMDTLELHCIDPTDIPNNIANADSTKMLYNSGPGTWGPEASNIGNCDDITNLEYDTTTFNWGGSNASLYTKRITLTGVRPINTVGYNESRYCFALVPAIRKETPQKTITDKTNWVIRCINPEIQVPTIEEFAGLSNTNTCNMSLDEASDSYKVTLNWGTPTGGIYNRFQVLAKKLAPGQQFNYDEFFDTNTTVTDLPAGADVESSSISPSVTHEKSSYLPIDARTMAIKKLAPGYTYQFAVLAVLDVDTGADFISEYNTGIVTCTIPLPRARFQEWTRVFAIGPKINGLMPKINPFHQFNDKAHLFEAINADGIPYEVVIDENNVPQTSGAGAQYMAPPGQYQTAPANFTVDVDAKPNSNNFYVSNQGVISLAWKDVDLEYMQSTFTDGQDLGARNNRRFGYRVYRSDDNRTSWVEVTDRSKLIHADDYEFYLGQNASSKTTARMAFFTDYSVQYRNSTDQSEYARTYWYKIVPVFDNRELTYYSDDRLGNNAHSLVRVTLPPANMALVHRLMANRRSCLELGSTYSYIDATTQIPNPQYACLYDGLGNRPHPVTKAWNKNDGQYIDQGGDLLVDRFELACNFTRGASNQNFTTGRSMFHPGLVLKEDNSPYTNQNNVLVSHVAEFKGSTWGASDGPNTFRGCVTPPYSTGKTFGGWGQYNDGDLATNHGATTFSDHYVKSLWGDCTLQNVGSMRVWASACDSIPTRDRPRTYFYPGLWDIRESSGDPDCTQTQADQPNIAAELRTPERMLNYTMQAENFAVMYSQTPLAIGGSGSSWISPYGPNDSAIYQGNSSRNESCFINLASIGSKTGSSDAQASTKNFWRSRWVGVNTAENEFAADGLQKTSSTHFYKMTASQVLSDTGLYDTTAYRAPDIALGVTTALGAEFPETTRYNANTPIGFIFSSNSAHLPPLRDIQMENAQELCNLREVKVGFLSGTTFVATEAPKKKRLPRRVEYIAMGAWPDSGDADGEYDYSSTNITNLEKGGTSTNGQCIGSNTLSAGSNIFVNTRFRSGMASKVNTPATKSHLFTGSSTAFDDTDIHSGNCVSQYGLHDVVGNLSELSTDLLNCDYGIDQIYYGPHTGNTFAGEPGGDPLLAIDLTKDIYGTINTALPQAFVDITNTIGAWLDNTGAFTWSSTTTNTVTNQLGVCLDTNGVSYPTIPQTQCGQPYAGIFTRQSTGSDNFWIKKGAPIVYRNQDGTRAASGHQTLNLKLYTVQNADSGYCALDNRDGSIYDYGSRFFLTNDIKPATRLGGSLNTSVVSIANKYSDNGIFDFNRDGEGFFLNFGPKHLGVRLNVRDTLHISSLSLTNTAKTVSGEEGSGFYFNPILGLPLACGEKTQGGSCADSDDNKNFSLTRDAGNITSTFQLGNSQIFNSGISSITWNSRALSETPRTGFFSFNFTGDYVTPDVSFIDRFDVYTDPTSGRARIVPHIVSATDPTYDYTSDTQAATALDGNSNAEFTSATFDVPRNAQLGFSNGGGVYRGPAGRFSLDINSNSSVVTGSGFRCMVKINED